MPSAACEVDDDLHEGLQYYRSKGENAMTTRQALLKEIEQVPEPLLPQVLDFIRFVRSRALDARFDTAVASDSALRMDWLRPEEDDS